VVGAELAAQIKRISIAIYQAAAAFALTKGIIIADTKFEFGLDDNGTLTSDGRGADALTRHATGQ
jgi:phosphoribosylaminoimidazole-succinocarboxamide synthase